MNTIIEFNTVLTNAGDGWEQNKHFSGTKNDATKVFFMSGPSVCKETSIISGTFHHLLSDLTLKLESLQFPLVRKVFTSSPHIWDWTLEEKQNFVLKWDILGSKSATHQVIRPQVVMRTSLDAMDSPIYLKAKHLVFGSPFCVVCFAFWMHFIYLWYLPVHICHGKPTVPLSSFFFHRNSTLTLSVLFDFAGDEVWVRYYYGSGDSPLIGCSSSMRCHGYTGFKLWTGNTVWWISILHKYFFCQGTDSFCPETSRTVAVEPSLIANLCIWSDSIKSIAVYSSLGLSFWFQGTWFASPIFQRWRSWKPPPPSQENLLD